MTLTPHSPAPAEGPPREATRPPRSRRAAWIVALAADTLQWALLPLFAPGAVSPVSDALDVAVGIILVRLLGWHWAFLPAFVAEVLPGVDLVPSWTLAVWLATRGSADSSKPREP